MGSKGNTNEDSWIVFEVTSDPGFFAQAQSGLDKLRQLENKPLSMVLRSIIPSWMVLTSLRMPWASSINNTFMDALFETPYVPVQ